MSNDLMLGGVYILMAVMLVLGSLMARREPLAKMLTMALAWVAIFAAGFGQAFHQPVNLLGRMTSSEEIEYALDYHARFTKVNGSTRASCTRAPQCRCGPVTRPVAPASPTNWSRSTIAPFFTSICDKWA